MEMIKGVPEGAAALVINLWVTSECNYNCTYCYEGGKKQHAYLDKAGADKIIDFVHKQYIDENKSVLWMNFHGGEPMLNSEIIKYVIDSIGAKGIVKQMLTTMTTNCYTYDESIVDYICQLSVSIDGCKCSHDLNRLDKGGNPTYERSIVNARKYLEKKPDVRLRMVVTPNNVLYLYEGVKELLDMGFRLIVPGVDYYAKDWTDELFDILYEQFVLIREYLNVNKITDATIGMLHDEPHRYSPCRFGCDGYQIDVDGRVYPCTYVVREPEYCVGSIDAGFDEKKISEINRISCKGVEECAGCGSYHYCTTNRCLILNKQLTGSYYTASPVVCGNQNVFLRLKGLL